MYLVSSTTNITEMLFIILRVSQNCICIEITIDCGGKTLMILKLRSLNHKHHEMVQNHNFLFFDILCFISMSNEPIHRLSNAY